MIGEADEVQKYFAMRFGIGIGNRIPNGMYAIPTVTSKGNAFMRIYIVGSKPFNKDGKNFHLYWDEALTISWYTEKRPWFLRESRFAKYFRKCLIELNKGL